TRAVLGANACRNGQGSRVAGDIRGVPDAARVDRVVARAQRDFLWSVRQFLDHRDLAFGADHDLVTRRVPLPGCPVLLEAVHRDEPPFVAVGGVAFDIGRVPVHAGE